VYISSPAVNRLSGSYVPIEQIPLLLPAHSAVSGLGLELEPKTLALGIGFLVLGVFLFGLGAGPKIETAKRKRRQLQIGKLREQIKAVEAKD